nr:hypothetical protein [Nanoarchaeota archaeon]
MSIINKIKECATIGMAYLIITTPIFILGEYGNLTRGRKQGYRVVQSCGIKQGEIKEVESFKEKYKYAEPWRAMTHYYNPIVIRQVKFKDGSEATLEYGLFSNCSFIKRKVLGPEPGEKCILEDKILKEIKQY